MSAPKNTQQFNISGGVVHSFGNIDQHLNNEPQTRSSQESQRPVRILFLAANPFRTSPLRLDQEVRAIAEVLRSAGAGEHFELEQSWAATHADLQDGLLRFRPELVHWSGHGNASGELELARVQVELARPEEANLPQLLALRSDPAELFLLPQRRGA